MHGNLSNAEEPAIRIERVAALSDAALAILEEYYDAVHVVKRDGPEAMRALIAEPDSGMWVARRGAEIVGCVVLRPLSSM